VHDTPLNQTLSATVAANGTAAVTYYGPGIRRTVVEQISVTGTAGAAGTPSADVFLNGQFLCASSSAQDTASDPPYVKLDTGDSLQVAWAGMLAGSQVQALFLGRVTSGGPGR
jgi:hypothetical protein